jgi:hypothetical protein
LGKRDLPQTIMLDGEEFQLERAFKHAFATAVGLYRRGDDRVVCKFHRQAAFFGFPLLWQGRMWASYEVAMLRELRDLPGVPRFRGMPEPAAVARDYVPGTPLERRMRVGDDFFPQLLHLLRRIHERGIAYVDLEKPENILLGEDGRPYLIDFQVGFYMPDRFFGQTSLGRYLRALLQRSDLYHAMKHYRRMRPDLLTVEERALGKMRPGTVRVANALVAPFRLLRKWALGKW